MEYIIGIDIGTTGTKSALYKRDGTLLDKEYRSYPIDYPKEGWAEQNPEDWWNALIYTVGTLVSRNREAYNIVSMSLSTQGGCLILLDENFHPIYNAVSWLDKRAQETSELLTRHISIEELYKTCGWPVINGLNFPTIFWFKEKRPDLFKNARYFASTIDYINYLLTGRFSIDYTNLALTGFLDLNRKRLSDGTLRIAGITRDNVPEVVPSGTVIGNLTKEAAKILGLNEDVTVVSGAHDQYCANIGTGAINTGDCVLDTGTSWVLLAISNSLYFSEESLTSNQGLAHAIFPGLHPIEGKYGLMTVVPYGGNSLLWFKDIFRKDSSFEQLGQDAGEVTPGSDGLIFIPIASSISGRGAFLGLDAVHTVQHYTRAVLEGVALANKLNLEIVEKSGIKINNLIMIGGGARSSFWPQIVADVLGIRVTIPEQKDAECAGAAILAGVGCRIFHSIEDVISDFMVGKRIVTPILKNVELYEKVYGDFIRYLGFV